MSSSKVPGSTGRDEQCYARSPGSLGVNDAADSEKPDWLTGDTPGVCGKNDAADVSGKTEQPEVIPVLCFDLARVEKFIHGVAFWRVQHRRMKIQFQPDEDQFWKMLNKVVFWTDLELGTVTVTTADKTTVEKEVARLSRTLLEEFLAEAAKGPAAVKKWLDQQAKIRDIAEQGYQKTMAEVNKINQNVAAAMSTPLKVLRTVKFVSDLTAEGIGIVNPLYTVGYTFVTVATEEYSKAQAVALIDSRADESMDPASQSVKNGATKAATSDEAVELYGKPLDKLERKFVQQAKKAQQQMQSHDAAIRKSEAKIRKHPHAPVKKSRTYDRIRRHVEKKTAAHGKAVRSAAREATTRSFKKAFRKVLFVYQLYDWWNLGHEYGTDMQHYD